MGNMFRLLTAREIECRIQQVKASGVSLLLYKDARCDQNILDETVGPMNWQRRHDRDNANCIVSIYDEKKKEWISKEDTGTESNTEPSKGLASDSFKRACVNWGIGRELYTAPFIWIGAEKCSITNGKCYDRFDVKDISYNENREINGLVIINAKTGQEVYRMGGKQETTKPVQKQEAPRHYVCSDCHKPIEDYTSGGKVRLTAHDIAARSMDAYGRQLCMECSKQARMAEAGKSA